MNRNRRAEVEAQLRASAERRREAREARMAKQLSDHKAVRDAIHAKTELATAMLAELAAQHDDPERGHFIDGRFVTGVSREDAVLAFQRPSSVPPR